MRERNDPAEAYLIAIVDIAKPLGIAINDHIIVGKKGPASLKGMRLV